MAERDIAYRIRLLFSKGEGREVERALDNIHTKLLNLDVGSAVDDFHSRGAAINAAAKSNLKYAALTGELAVVDQQGKKAAESIKKVDDAANNAGDSVSNAEEQLRELIKQLVRAVAEGGDFEATLGQVQTRLGNLSAQSGDDLKQLAEQMGLTAAQAKRLDDAVRAAQGANAYRNQFRQTRSLTGATEGLSGLGAAASELGLSNVGGGLTAVAALSQVSEEIPKLQIALKGLPATIKAVAQGIGAPTLGLVGALGLLAVTLTFVTNKANEQREAAAALLLEQGKYFEYIQTATDEQIATDRQAAQDRLDAARANRDLLTEQQRLVREGVDELGRNSYGGIQNLLNLGIELGIVGGEVKALDQAVSDANAEVGAAEKAMQNLEDAAASSAVAINNAEEAERRLADARVKQANQYLSTAQAIDALRDQDAEALRTQEADLQRLNQLLRNAQAGLGDTTGNKTLQDQFQAFQDQIDQNQSIIDAINGVYLSQAVALETLNKELNDATAGFLAQANQERVLNALRRDGSAETAGARLKEVNDELAVLSTMQDQLLALPKLTGDALSQYEANVAAMNDLIHEQAAIIEEGPRLLREAKLGLKNELSEIADELKADLADMAKDRKKADADAEKDAQKDRDDALKDQQKKTKEATDKYNKDREEALKKHNDRLKKIQEDVDFDLRRAIRARDAGAAEKIIEEARKKQREEDEQFGESQVKLRENLQEQLDKIDEAYKEQLAVIEERLAEQLQKNREAYTEQVQKAKEAARKESEAKRAEYEKQIADLTQFLNNARATAQGSQRDQLTDLNDFGREAGKIIGEFAQGAVRSLLTMLRSSTTVSGLGGVYQSPNITVNSSVSVTTRSSASADEIAKKTTKKVTTQLRKDLQRSRTGGV